MVKFIDYLLYLLTKFIFKKLSLFVGSYDYHNGCGHSGQSDSDDADSDDADSDDADSDDQPGYIFTITAGLDVSHRLGLRSFFNYYFN